VEVRSVIRQSQYILEERSPLKGGGKQDRDTMTETPGRIRACDRVGGKVGGGLYPVGEEFVTVEGGVSQEVKVGGGCLGQETFGMGE